MLPWQPIKYSDLNKIHMNRRGLLKKHFCKKKNLSICSETAKIANFHFSHYKSMEAISEYIEGRCTFYSKYSHWECTVDSKINVSRKYIHSDNFTSLMY